MGSSLRSGVSTWPTSGVSTWPTSPPAAATHFGPWPATWRGPSTWRQVKALQAGHSLANNVAGFKTKPLVFVEGTPQADLSHACTDGTENADDTSCGNDADAYGNNSSSNANADGVT